MLTAALGIDQATLFTAVFALGAFLAGLAGALQLPREPANLGMDLAIIADAFVVTVVGGLGSIPGAFLAALDHRADQGAVHRARHRRVVGIDDRVSEAHAGRRVRRDGDRAGGASRRACSATPPAAPATTPLPEQRALVRAPGARDALDRARC